MTGRLVQPEDLSRLPQGGVFTFDYLSGNRALTAQIEAGPLLEWSADEEEDIYNGKPLRPAAHLEVTFDGRTLTPISESETIPPGASVIFVVGFWNDVTDKFGTKVFLKVGNIHGGNVRYSKFA
jgi:hypothetical protein